MERDATKANALPQGSPEWVDEVVSYHSPSSGAIEAISAIRRASAIMITTIFENCPPCADRSTAVRYVREAMMTANASIVLGGLV